MPIWQWVALLLVGLPAVLFFILLLIIRASPIWHYDGDLDAWRYEALLLSDWTAIERRTIRDVALALMAFVAIGFYTRWVTKHMPKRAVVERPQK